MTVESVMPSNHLILCCPLFLLPSIFPSILVFSNELALHIRWPKYYSVSSVLPMKIQDWLPLGLTGWVSMQSHAVKGLSRVFSNTTVQNTLGISLLYLLYGPTLTSIYNYGESHSFDYKTFVGKVTSLLLNMLSKLVIAFLPRSKCILISWLESPSIVIQSPRN